MWFLLVLWATRTLACTDYALAHHFSLPQSSVTPVAGVGGVPVLAHGEPGARVYGERPLQQPHEPGVAQLPTTIYVVVAEQPHLTG